MSPLSGPDSSHQEQVSKTEDNVLSLMSLCNEDTSLSEVQKKTIGKYSLYVAGTLQGLEERDEWQAMFSYSKAKKWSAKDTWPNHVNPGPTLDRLASMCCELSIRPNGEDWTLRCEDLPESQRATMDEYCDLWMKETGESFMSSAECTDARTDVGIQGYQTRGSPGTRSVHARIV
jgi:hypothetical protein